MKRRTKGCEARNKMKIAYICDAVYLWVKGVTEKRIYEISSRWNNNKDLSGLSTIADIFIPGNPFRVYTGFSSTYLSWNVGKERAGVKRVFLR